MNIKELQDKSILLFGKSRAFSMDEFESQIKFHGIKLVNEFCDDVALIIDGKMMTPYEQKDSERLYEKHFKVLDFVSIDAFEKELSRYLDADTLLMSLKLSHDKERLKSFLQNSMIEDELFFKLLRMYSWGGEDFFENDNNRDVSAALILRFYQNIERNHNVQYATSGLTHLVLQTNREELIEAISHLEPLQKSFDADKKSANYSILTSIAMHSNVPKSVLKLFIKKSDSYIKTLIAMRRHCEEDLQELLYDSLSDEVHEALSYNYSLSKDVVNKFLESKKYVKNIARYIKLDDELFELLLEEYPSSLALNESLFFDMQQRLLSLHVQEVMLHLALNTHLDSRLIGELLSEDSDDIRFAIYENTATPRENLEEAYKDEKNHIYLANNENTPSHILQALAQSKNIEVLKALAKNKNTPIEFLYQFQLDARLAREVKENPAFGRHIQQENIGWEV